MKRRKRVLIVDDTYEHGQIMLKAFQFAPAWETKLVTDGAEALDIMGVAGRGKCSGGWRPDVVVLNLRLPKLSGFEVLEWMKGIPQLAMIPVVIWTVSVSPGDIRRSYKLGAVAHFTKPVDIDKIGFQAQVIRQFFDQAQFLEEGFPENGGKT